MTRALTSLLLMAALVGATDAGTASAASSSSSNALPQVRIADPAPDPEDVERARWQKLAVDAYRDLAAARHRYDAATADYSRLRSHNRDRGDTKVRAMQERDDAAAALASAEAHLESLADTARKAGVPPGWIRVFEEDWMSETQPASIP